MLRCEGFHDDIRPGAGAVPALAGGTVGRPTDRAQGTEFAVVIPTVDAALENLLRTELPLPTALGDVSFDPPSGTWSAQLSRITVNLFLFGVGRSAQQPRPPAERTVDGQRQRRPALPMIDLRYLVSAWTGSIRDEHQLLGDLFGVLLRTQVMPVEHLPVPPASSVQMSIPPADDGRISGVWSTIGATVKPSFELLITTAAQDLAFEGVATPVQRIEAMVAPKPRTPDGTGDTEGLGGPRDRR